MIHQLQLGLSAEYTILLFIVIIFAIAFFIVRYFQIENTDGFILVFLIVLAIASINLSFLANIFYLVIFLFFMYLYIKFKPKSESEEIQ